MVKKIKENKMGNGININTEFDEEKTPDQIYKEDLQSLVEKFADEFLMVHIKHQVEDFAVYCAELKTNNGLTMNINIKVKQDGI